MQTLTPNPIQARDELVRNASDRAKNISQARQSWAGERTLIAFYPEFFGMVFADKMGSDGKIAAMFFKNNATKPEGYTMFKSFDELKSYAQTWSNFELKKIADKQAKSLQKSMLNIQDYINIGDVFTSSWGYEVTYIDYYQVVGFKGKQTVLLREIASNVTEDNYNHGTCVPAIDHFVNDEVIEKRVSVRFGAEGEVYASVKISDIRTACLERKQADGTYREHHWSRDW